MPSPIRSGQVFFQKNETRSFRVVGGKEKILLPRTLAGASSLCVQQESFLFVWLPERLASPARGARGNRLPRKLWASFECEAPVFTPLIGEARPDFSKIARGTPMPGGMERMTNELR